MSLLCFHVGSIPDCWAVLNAMPARDREVLLGKVLELPPADTDSLIEEHSEYLGLHMRNTKYMAAEVPPRPFRGAAKGAQGGSCDDASRLCTTGVQQPGCTGGGDLGQPGERRQAVEPVPDVRGRSLAHAAVRVRAPSVCHYYACKRCCRVHS